MWFLICSLLPPFWSFQGIPRLKAYLIPRNVWILSERQSFKVVGFNSGVLLHVVSSSPWLELLFSGELNFSLPSCPVSVSWKGDVPGVF